MKVTLKKWISSALAIAMLLSLMPAFSISVHAAGAEPRTTGLDLTGTSVSYLDIADNTETKNPAEASIDDTKEGWEWDAESKTLTLSGADISTTAASETALTLPTGASIIVDADSEISSADGIGLECTGANIYVKDGVTLTIAGGTKAVQFDTTEPAGLEITASTDFDGSLADTADIVFGGTTYTIGGADVKYVEYTPKAIGGLTVVLTKGTGDATLEEITEDISDYDYYYREIDFITTCLNPLVYNSTDLDDWTQFSADKTLTPDVNGDVSVQVIKVEKTSSRIKSSGTAACYGINAANTGTGKVGARSVSIDGDVFAGSSYFELGVSSTGSFGTKTQYPAAGINGTFFHPTESGKGLGMVANPTGKEDDWNTQTSDFFMPGTVDEGFLIGWNNTLEVIGAEAASASNTNIESAVTTNYSSGDALLVVTRGTTTNGIYYEQVVKFEKDSKSFVTTVTLWNISEDTMPGLRYMRRFDPDQTIHGGGYVTRNVVGHEALDKHGTSVIAFARTSVGLDVTPYIFFSDDPRATAGYASPTALNFSALFDNSKMETKKGASDYTDTDILIYFDLGNLAPKEKTSFSWISSLDTNLNDALGSLTGGEFTGNTIKPPKEDTDSGSTITDGSTDNDNTISAPDFGAIVDGNELNITTNSVDKENSHTTTTVDEGALRDSLTTSAGDVTIIIPKGTDSGQVDLSLQSVKDIADTDSNLSVKNDDIIFTFPPNSINTETTAGNLSVDNLSDAVVSVNISRDEGAAAVSGQGFTAVSPVVRLSVTVNYGAYSENITDFDSYITGRIELTAAEAASITTALAIDEDGNSRHLPTYVYTEDGKWYARVSTLNDEDFVLIYNSQSFDDAEGKWYEDAVNEMASRKIVNGVSDTSFAGDSPITRAEFAAVMVSALGLPRVESTAAFLDISEDAWYADAVSIAAEYGIITGRDESTFDPTAMITRQEAMAMLQRAADIVSFEGEQGDCTRFADSSEISAWAEDAAAFCIGTGLFIGNNGELNPQRMITRGETGTITLRFLQATDLIDVRTVNP